jgi:hypothetical protein
VPAELDVAPESLNESQEAFNNWQVGLRGDNHAGSG